MKMVEDLGVILYKDTDRQKKRVGIFECECGEQIRRTFVQVKGQKHCQSCANRIKSTTHGKSQDSLHKRWKSMLSRCHNPKDSQYKNYGAKGVQVCQEWRDSFLLFEEWAYNNGYKKELELDKDIMCRKLGFIPYRYSPITCIWVTRSENQKNKMDSKKSGCTSKHLGVSWNKSMKKWKCTYKRRHCGYYDTEEEASKSWINQN